MWNSIKSQKLKMMGFVGAASVLVIILLLSFGINQQPALADVNMLAAHTQQHELLLSARESEMAEMLMRTNFIEAATVGLNMSYTTAMVNVIGARMLTPEDGKTIALMVTRMVDGLSLENVTVIDDNYSVLFDNSSI